MHFHQYSLTFPIVNTLAAEIPPRRNAVPGAEGGGDDEERHSGMLHLQMLGEVVERVAELHSEGRGLQRFYREKVLDVD